MNAKRISLIIAVVVIFSLLMTACGYHHGIKSCGYGGFLGIGMTWVNQGQLHPENSNFVCDGTNFVPVTSETTTTQASASNPAPAATTEAPAATEAFVPAPVSCESPSIKASEDGNTFTEYGEYLNTELGERMTFTNRKVIVPDKAWNETLSAQELKDVENTWLFLQVCIPQGTYGRLFAGGFEQKLHRYDNGVFMTLQPGYYEFKLRNGEFIVWYPNQDTPARKDVDRVVAQIKNGNFDIHSSLAFFGTTADLLPLIPQDLVKADNVQVIPVPDPMVK